MTLSALTITLQSHVDRHHVGQAAAIYSFMRSMGLAVGVAICGTALENCLRNQLADHHLPKSIAENIAGYILTLNSLLASQHAFATAVRLAVASAHKNVYELITAVVGVAFLLILGIQPADMNQRLASKHLLEKQKGSAGPEQQDLEANQMRAVGETAQQEVLPQ